MVSVGLKCAQGRSKSFTGGRFDLFFGNVEDRECDRFAPPEPRLDQTAHTDDRVRQLKKRAANVS